jgi:hypothetical protein
MLAVLFAALPLILAVGQLVAPFGTWDSRSTLQIGNEATHNRPWLGKIHFVALYKRALAADEVARHYHRGPSSSPRLPREDLVALYEFNEGSGNVVRDVSGLEPALDLSFSPKGRVRWLEAGNGIEIGEPTIVRSRKPPTKLLHALRATHELSIEVWMTPDNAVQGGPARIVSFSRNTGARNFTLGQEGHEIEFRVRTPVSGTNGMPLALKSGKEIAAGQQAQLVATYEDGVERLYINGKQQAEGLDLPNDGIVGFGTRRTLITRFAYSFFYFFPVSFFLTLFFSTPADRVFKRVLVPIAIATGLAVLSEGFQALLFKRSLDESLLLAGIIIAMLGALSGQIFAVGDRIEGDNIGGFSRS